MSNLLVYINGNFVPQSEAKVSVYDHGFLYGDGVFESIKAYGGRVFKLKEHVDRLYDSAKAIAMDIHLTKDEMIEVILETIRKNNLKDAYIRVVVSRGIGDLGLDPRKCEKSSVIVIAQGWRAMYSNLYEIGITGVSVCVRRNAPDALSPNIKSLNYLNNILAKIEANEKGGDEAIFLDQNGFVCEGSADNIFVVKNDKVYTPFTTSNLKGITKATAIEVMDEMGYETIEANLGLFDLYTADEIFVTGTLAEMISLIKVDGRQIGDGKPGPLTKKLAKCLKEVTTNNGTQIYS
jgi:branched-chain amino acid aminotransferase